MHNGMICKYSFKCPPVKHNINTGLLGWAIKDPGGLRVVLIIRGHLLSGAPPLG